MIAKLKTEVYVLNYALKLKKHLNEADHGKLQKSKKGYVL